MPQLHAFLNNVGDKLLQDDICQICEAVAYVISSMSLQESAQWLQTISSDILSKVHAVVLRPDPATKEELQRVCSEYLIIIHIGVFINASRLVGTT